MSTVSITIPKDPTELQRIVEAYFIRKWDSMRMNKFDKETFRHVLADFWASFINSDPLNSRSLTPQDLDFVFYCKQMENI